MQTTPLAALLLAATLPMAALADDTALSYRFVDLRYVGISLKDPSIDAKGFALSGTYLLGPRLFLAGSAALSETDEVVISGVRGSSSSTSFSIGPGGRYPLSPKLDAQGAVALLQAQSKGKGGFGGNVSDTGYGLSAGLRGLPGAAVELAATVSYTKIFDSGSTTLNGEALYHFTPLLALVAGAGVSKDATNYSAGLRLKF